jgi:hypothetical protein
VNRSTTDRWCYAISAIYRRIRVETAAVSQSGLRYGDSLPIPFIALLEIASVSRYVQPETAER